MLLKKKKIFFLLAVVLFSWSFFLRPTPYTLHPVFADCDPSDFDCKLREKEKEIRDLQGQLQEAQAQEKTLSSELKKIDGQIKLTELKIEEAQFQITKLEKEIGELNGRIDRLSTTVDKMSQVLLNRIVSTYKYNNYSTVDLLFSAHGFSDLLERVKYLQVIQANDKKVLYQLQATKETYNDQKNDKQTRQVQQQAAKKQLESLQAELAVQKKAKDDLLRITQNNEKIFQQKLKAAQDEQRAIRSLLDGGGKEVVVGHVNKGDNIGTVIIGASACSTGTHLHFEVHKDKALQNPSSYLSNKDVIWDNSPDGSFGFGGSWDLWPVSDPVRITQGFGSTWYAQHGWYENPPGHTGIDMASDSGPAVKSVKDGELSRGTIDCGGRTLYYKKVDQGDGILVYYLHML